jgi:SSS family solute:Na+ symporter
MLGLMIWSTYLVLTRLVELPPSWAWAMIILLVILAGLYTAWGGLKSVVWTDSAQGIVMIVAALVIFGTVWNAAGGWSGLEAKLLALDQANANSHKSDLLHIGRFRGDHGELSPYLVVLGWTIVGSGYWTVNHTQTMRLMGCRSITDMKYAAIFGVFLSLPVMMISACLGVFVHGIDNLPAWEDPDALYPILANHFLMPGLKGIVVAGVVAAVVSTFDSMGSALSAIFTRDIYARVISKDRSDAHYVLVGRIATAGVLMIGFAYLPFIWRQKQMLDAFTTLIPVFVTPLCVIYVLGVLTPVHRRSGIIGLCTGALYGVVALYNREILKADAFLPTWFTERWVAYSWSILFTLVPMLIATLVLGKENLAADEAWIEHGWLQRSREELPPFLPEDPKSARKANLLAVALLAFCGWVTFVWLW